MFERSNSTWPFIQTLIAPVKSPRGVIMTSKNTHCPTGTAIGDVQVRLPLSPLCGPFAGARPLGLQVSAILLPEPPISRTQIGAPLFEASFEAICQWLYQPPTP